MPYFDDLFNRLNSGMDVELSVTYLERGFAAYPMVDATNPTYPHSFLDGWKGLRPLYQLARRQPDTRWVVVGWGHPRHVVLLTFLSLSSRQFWLFTDTPIPDGRTAAPWKRSIRRRLLRFWIGRSAGVLGTGRLAIQRLIEMGVPTAKLESLPYPLDEARFEVGSDYAVGSSEPVVIVCSGRLSIRDKRFDLAIRALSLLLTDSKQDAEVRLVIAGDGPDLGTLDELSRDLGVADIVDFVGWLSQRELRDLYRRGNVYLHPTDFEPYGVTVVEALYSGLFVISTDQVGAAVELIHEDINGSTFDVGDLEGLTQLLRDTIVRIRSGGVRKRDVRAASLAWELDRYIPRLLEIIR